MTLSVGFAANRRSYSSNARRVKNCTIVHLIKVSPRKGEKKLSQINSKLGKSIHNLKQLRTR